MKTMIFTIANWLFICSVALAAPGDDPPPNILFFIVDDLGWQDTSLRLHAQGPPHRDVYRTPQLERLAAEGISRRTLFVSKSSSNDTSTGIC